MRHDLPAGPRFLAPTGVAGLICLAWARGRGSQVRAASGCVPSLNLRKGMTVMPMPSGSSPTRPSQPACQLRRHSPIARFDSAPTIDRLNRRAVRGARRFGRVGAEQRHGLTERHHIRHC